MLTIFAAEGPNGVHIASDVNEVYWGSVAFFVLIGLIWWKAGDAIKGAITGRTERIRAELADAETARTEAELALTTSTSDLPDVSSEEARIKAEAVETAEKVKTDGAAKAEADAAALLERARGDAESMRNQAMADIREEVARVTRDGAQVVVTDALDSSSHNDLIDRYISQVAQS